jgi:exonuclease SbcD
MRILHFADLHLGTESYGSLDPSTGLSTRLQDILMALDRLVDYAIDEKVDLVLFCGDAYKSRDPTQTQQREFAKRIRRLSEAGVPFFLLVGNHDMPNALGKATTMEIFDTLAVSNVYIASRPGIYKVQTGHGVLQIAAMPWLRRSALLTRENMKNLTVEQVNQELESAITRKIQELSEEVDRSLPCMLAAHVWIAGARVGSEKGMLIGNDPAVLVSNVALDAFDYVALGHIHRQQKIHDSPPVVYSGSLERLDFSDEGRPKGFYVIDIDASKKVEFRFHEIPVRLFTTIEIEIAETDAAPLEKALSAIAARQLQVKDAVVKVKLSLPVASQSQVSDNELRNALKEAAFVTISRDLQTKSRARSGMTRVEDLAPLAALKVYLDARKVSPERQKTLIEYGERLIAGSIDHTDQ